MIIQRIDGLPESARLAVTEFTFVNSEYDQALWENKLNPMIQMIEQEFTIERIREEKRIIATKRAYKKMGLDPSRYRPSSESLLRRVCKGNGLYRINTLVDVNNYLSLYLRLPVGSYDLEKLNGSLAYSVGQEGERYQGIGKKIINIHQFPVLSDSEGPFGSPISDSTRAMISVETTRALLVVYSFEQTEDELEDIQQQVKQQLTGLIPSIEIVKQSIG